MTDRPIALAPTGLAPQLKRQGDWLFRRRGYVPIPLLTVVATVGVSTGGTPRGLGVVEPWQAFGLAVGLLGFAVRAFAIGYAAPNTSGGNTRQQAAEELNTDGAYSLVRHPLYLGNALIWFGVALLPGSALGLVAVLPWFVVHYGRIILAEESFLHDRFGDQFRRWSSRTPTLVPDVSGWRAPRRAFSWRAVLRREYSGVLGFTVAATIVEIASTIHEGFGWYPGPVWVTLSGLATCFYLAVRTLRRLGLLEEAEALPLGETTATPWP